ncbi:unnamed protein product [Litomosoides sigmodontis]|uniref:Uncharacterized protein n=1 Tax=Litomosoides sigmodontis TaxID=42156 RepID=A0A3P6SYZ6_LITSI|nr:unnamed protein product [Litomosoides sigmodontis]
MDGSNEAEVEVSDEDLEDEQDEGEDEEEEVEEDEEIECELVSDTEEKLETKLTDKSPDASPKHSERNQSTSDASPDNNAKDEAEKDDLDDELEPDEVPPSWKFPKPKHDIRFNETSPTGKKPKPKTLPEKDPERPASKKPIGLRSEEEPEKSDEEFDSELVSAPTSKKPNLKLKDPEDAELDESDAEPDDEELEPELVSSPTSRRPNLQLKDPADAKPKRKPRAKSNESDAEPDDEELEPELVSAPTSRKPNLKLKDPADAKPKRKPKAKSNESNTEPDDEELEPEFVSAPASKKPNLKLKDPESAEPNESDAEPDDEECEPELISEVPTAPVPKPKKHKSGKPKVPATKSKNPKDKLRSPELETHATLPLSKKRTNDEEEGEPEEPDENSEPTFDAQDVTAENEPEGNKNASRKKRSKQKKKKRKPQWIPPPRTPPEPYEMPPEEKKLAERLKEEGIPPTQRYARKLQHSDVIIPFEIPWENAPALQTQAGMGAFGHTRDANIKINQGSKPLVQGDLHSETLIPLFSRSIGDNRYGMLPFGSYRRNVSDVIDNHKFNDSKLKESDRFIPKFMQGAVQPNNAETLFGQIRNQTTQVKYLDYMSPTCDPGSHTFISRQFAPALTDKAGSCIIDRRRNVITNAQDNGQDIGVFDRASESIMPLLFNVQDINLKSGTDFGAFRPLISESEGGIRMNLTDEIKCKLIVPYQTAPSLVQ